MTRECVPAWTIPNG